MTQRLSELQKRRVPALIDPLLGGGGDDGGSGAGGCRRRARDAIFAFSIGGGRRMSVNVVIMVVRRVASSYSLGAVRCFKNGRPRRSVSCGFHRRRRPPSLRRVRVLSPRGSLPHARIHAVLGGVALGVDGLMGSGSAARVLQGEG